ncbi:hypothetical protein DR85_1894 [Francisella tularensis]|nr:hypothetical protein DR85_1894 [Francisella tularensis]
MVILPTDLPIAWLSSLSYPVAQACALAIVESSINWFLDLFKRFIYYTSV